MRALKMRELAALVVARVSSRASRSTGAGSGSALPGLLAQRIHPGIVAGLAKRIPNGIILVTGTNGKTTTSMLITRALELSGHRVVSNSSGSNMLRGIASSLCERSSLFGDGIDGDIAVLEVDEATMPELTRHVSPRMIVVTNLFRDQLDRFGGVGGAASLIAEAIRLSPDASILLNADDPLVASLGRHARNAAYFGVSSDYRGLVADTGESGECVDCGHELTYSQRYYSHLGSYECAGCGRKRPELDVSLHDVRLGPDSSTATIGTDHPQRITIGMPGMFNAYNAIAAIAAAERLDVDREVVKHTIASTSPAFGRLETVFIGSKKITLLLVKNPAGFNQSMEALTLGRRRGAVMVGINDNVADGTDVSWLWDVNFEDARELFGRASVTGRRADDLLARFREAGVDMDVGDVEHGIARAFESAVAKLNGCETLDVFCNYTAMLELRKHLSSKGHVRGPMV